MRPTIFVATAAMSLMALGYAAAQTMPSSVHAMGGLLMDSKGMTLYTYDNDKEPNKSSCIGNCLSNWPALKAEASDRNMGDYTVIMRDDGARQWAYKGKPLYYFVMDKAAGDKTGDGRGNGVWHIAKP